MMHTPVVGCVMWTPGMLNTVNCSSIEGMYLVVMILMMIMILTCILYTSWQACTWCGTHVADTRKHRLNSCVYTVHPQNFFFSRQHLAQLKIGTFRYSLMCRSSWGNTFSISRSKFNISNSFVVYKTVSTIMIFHFYCPPDHLLLIFHNGVF